MRRIRSKSLICFLVFILGLIPEQGKLAHTQENHSQRRPLQTEAAVAASLCATLSKEVRQLINKAPQAKFQFYSIRADDETSLRQAMDTLGPVDQYGVRRDAYTGWYIRWRWPTKDGQSLFEQVKVRRSIDVTLPCWEEGEREDVILRQKWDGFVLATLKHELGHVKIVEENYLSVRDAIRNEDIENKKLNSKKANQIGNNVLEHIRKLDLEYDKTTKHGRTQGVKFP